MESSHRQASVAHHTLLKPEGYFSPISVVTMPEAEATRRGDSFERTVARLLGTSEARVLRTDVFERAKQPMSGSLERVWQTLNTDVGGAGIGPAERQRIRSDWQGAFDRLATAATPPGMARLAIRAMIAPEGADPAEEPRPSRRPRTSTMPLWLRPADPVEEFAVAVGGPDSPVGLTETQAEAWAQAARLLARPPTPRREQLTDVLTAYQVPISNSPDAKSWPLEQLISGAKLGALVLMTTGAGSGAVALAQSNVVLALLCVGGGIAASLLLVGGTIAVLKALESLD